MYGSLNKEMLMGLSSHLSPCNLSLIHMQHLGFL